MNQKQAEKLARERLEGLLGDLRQLRGVIVPLVRYPTELDYMTVAPSDGWEWAVHESVMESAYDILTSVGARPRYSQVGAVEYIEWLHREGKKNSTTTRAEYASLVAPKAK